MAEPPFRSSSTSFWNPHTMVNVGGDTGWTLFAMPIRPVTPLTSPSRHPHPPSDSASEPGTIRGDFCIELGRNVIHGSDAVESAQHEIALWFPEGVTNYEHTAKAWIYE